MPTEVFVSHSHADQPFAERLVGVLGQHRIPFWYSDAHIRGAQQWHDEIGMALQRCDWFILVLSPDSVTSRWVKRELLYALQQERFDGRIVPLLYRACDSEQLSWTLPQLQSIDFSASFDDGCIELLRIWNVQYAPAA